MFIPVDVNVSGHLYDDFLCLIFLHDYREDSALIGELTGESDRFRFLRTDYLTNFKVSVGLVLAKSSVMRVTFPSTYLHGLS